MSPIEDAHRPVPYHRERVADDVMLVRVRQLLASVSTRRSIRRFATDPVPRAVVEDALRVAGTAPSGAHRQPWTWVVVTDPDTKARLRAAAEEEERRFYAERATDEWLEALAPLGTDDVKTHLTDAPYVLVLFARGHEVLADGSTAKNYYVTESCALSAGFLLVALHEAGLATLTHTPSPMRFLNELLERPSNERPLLVIPVGHPHPDATVPDLERKPLEAFTVWR